MNVGILVGEMKNFGKDFLKVIIGGLLVVMVVYFIINLVYFWVLLVNELVNYVFFVLVVVEVIFGLMGGKIIFVGILILVFGVLNGFLLIGLRVVYILVIDKILLKYGIFFKLNFV